MRDQLRPSAAALGRRLSASEEDAFERYLALLLRWNARINLTAVRDPIGIVGKHFVDSLAVVPHVPGVAASMVDVGSGAGFPGAVIALVRPALAVTLVESNHKKAAFLSTLRREIPLPNLRVEAARVEDFLAAPGFQPFDVAVSRATLDLPEWLQLGHRLVRHPGGTVLAMEGAERRELPAGCVRHEYSIPGGQRAIIVWQDLP